MVHEDGCYEDRRLAAYLGSELGPADVEAVEAHLLHCDRCWQAVHEARRGRALAESMRELAPASLRDRVRMSVEAAPPALRTHRRRRRRARSAATVVAALALVGGMVWAGAGRGGSDPESVTAVVQAAAERTPPSAVVADGHEIALARDFLDGHPVTVARSAAPFDMPPGGRHLSGPDTPWVARRASMTVVCLSGPDNVLVVADLPAERLIAWATRGAAALVPG
ncbi:MAG: anti-sigma factor family protein [Acidimicrobiales bacterium]